MISIIIPVYNNREIRPCLQAIFKADYENKEVIVVNNASSDPMVKHIIEGTPAKYILEKTPGSYIARNRGAQEATGDILAFIDADCIIQKDWFTEIEKQMQKHDVLMGQIKDINRNKIATLESEFYQATMYPALAEEDLKRIDTRNFIVKRDLFLKYPFDPQFKYGGDMELGARLHSYNIKIKYAKSIIVYHLNETSIYTIIKKRIKQNYDNFNLTKKFSREYILEYFPHLIRYSELPGAKFWRYYYGVLIILNWPFMLLYLYLFPKKLKYIYFKGLNVLAIRYGILKNAVQKTIQ